MKKGYFSILPDLMMPFQCAVSGLLAGWGRPYLLGAGSPTKAVKSPHQ